MTSCSHYLLLELICRSQCRKLHSQNDDYFCVCSYVCVFHENLESEQAWNYFIVMQLDLIILHLKRQLVLDSSVQAHLVKLSDNPLTHVGLSSNPLGAVLVIGSARTHSSTFSPDQYWHSFGWKKKKEFSHFSLLTWQNHHIYTPIQTGKREEGMWKGEGEVTVFHLIKMCISALPLLPLKQLRVPHTDIWGCNWECKPFYNRKEKDVDVKETAK